MGFIESRYQFIRAISVPIPFTPNRIPIIGGRTLIELFTFLAMTILAVVVGCREGKLAGNTCDWIGAFVILASLRNFNFYHIVFGISFERALYWHKLGGNTLFDCNIMSNNYGY